MESLESLVSRKGDIEAVLSRIEVWLLVFGIFVVVGVAGESVYGIRAWWNNRKLHDLQRSIDKMQQNEVTSALRTSEARIAEANRAAAEANLQLLKMKTPRLFTLEQISRFHHRLKNFSGTVFELYVNNDPEAVGLMNSIDDLLRNAGWKFKRPAGPISLGDKAAIVAARGVAIEISHEDLASLRAPIEALTAALREAGIAANAVSASDRKTDGIVRVVVGAKPLD